MKAILGTDNWSWLLSNFNNSSENITAVLSTGSFGGYSYYHSFDVIPTLFLNSTETIYEDNSDGSSTSPYKLNP